jgi:hypothetical protein
MISFVLWKPQHKHRSLLSTQAKILKSPRLKEFVFSLYGLKKSKIYVRSETKPYKTQLRQSFSEGRYIL